MSANFNGHLVLLGDSTIDNVVWVAAEDCIHSQLTNAIPNARITNYAADGYTSQNLLKGAVPIISSKARKLAGDPYPDSSFFAPLTCLESLHAHSEVTHVLVSIGGNDVREILSHMAELPARVAGFQHNYPRIIERILSTTKKVIVMLQYRPSFTTDNYGVYDAMRAVSFGQNPIHTLHALMEVIYPSVLSLARQHRFPIIDLPNTFDIYDESLYVCQIEPSGGGGTIITKMITHVLEQHDWEGESKLYSYNNRDDSFHQEANTESLQWKVRLDAGENGMIVAILKGMLSQGSQPVKKQELSSEYQIMLRQLEEMGFTGEKAKQALMETGNVEAALNRLLK